MINLLVTIFGGLLLIGGFFGMSFGFATPPNFGFFILGLVSSVFGIILMIFFAGRINLSTKSKSPKPKVNITKQLPKQVKAKDKKGPIERIEKNVKPAAKSSPKIRPITPKPVKDAPKVKSEKDLKEIKPITSRPIPKKINQQNDKKIVKKTSEPPEFSKEQQKKPVTVSRGLQSQKPTTKTPNSEKESKSPISKTAPPISKEKPNPIKPVLLKESESGKTETEPNESVKPVPKHFDISKLRSASSSDKDDQEFVKNRLNRLKENYIKNAKDIESIIDERLDSFKGTLDTLKSESQEPSIIWSFDAGDVQDALKDTISKANEKILMMYPWIRNIDVSILKKFMDTDSRMIIQEASLDDDTSVELIKLLTEKNVKIRTMPHIHTVAVVSDNTNGLIISTDPIYESFEVGVMYKDQKSIEEIERLFDDAWDISKDLDMEIKG